MHPCHAAIHEMDLNKNGKVTWFEFRSYITNNYSASKDADAVIKAGAKVGGEGAKRRRRAGMLRPQDGPWG